MIVGMNISGFMLFSFMTQFLGPLDHGPRIGPFVAAVPCGENETVAYFSSINHVQGKKNFTNQRGVINLLVLFSCY